MNTPDDRELEQLLAPDLTWGIVRTAGGYLGLVRDPACHTGLRTVDDHRARLVADAAAGCPERLAQAHAVLWALAEPAPTGIYTAALMPAYVERQRAAQRLYSRVLTDWREEDRSSRRTIPPAPVADSRPRRRFVAAQLPLMSAVAYIVMATTRGRPMTHNAQPGSPNTGLFTGTGGLSR